jgi:hypothetical protein
MVARAFRATGSHFDQLVLNSFAVSHNAIIGVCKLSGSTIGRGNGGANLGDLALSIRDTLGERALALSVTAQKKNDCREKEAATKKHN